MACFLKTLKQCNWIVIHVILVVTIVDCWLLELILSSLFEILIHLLVSLCWTRLRGYFYRLFQTKLLTFSDWIVIVALGAIMVSCKNVIYA